MRRRTPGRQPHAAWLMPRCAEGIQVLAADYDLKPLQVESATTCTPAAEYATRRCGVTSSATGAAARPSSPGTCVGSARRRLGCVVEARVQVLDDAHGFGTARRRSGLEHRDQAEELVVIVLVDGELAIAANSIFGRSTQSIACDENVVAGSIFRQAPCRPRVRWSARKSSNSIPSACMRPRRDFAISHCPPA